MPPLSDARKFAIAVAIVLLILGNLPTIVAYFTPKPVPVQINPVDVSFCAPLSNYAGANPIKVDGAKNEYANVTGVPDYQVNIYVNTANAYQANLDQIHVLINDTGIVKMTEPYFYILVFNPQDILQFMYPCPSGSTTDYFNGYTSPSTSCTYSGECMKWADETPTTGDFQGGSYHCTNNTQVYMSNGACITRQQLISGQISSTQPINYTFTPNQAGIWTAYVFVFDVSYQPRANLLFCNTQNVNTKPCVPNSEINAIAGTSANFQISSGIPPAPVNQGSISINPINVVSEGVTFLVAAVGYFMLGSDKIFPYVKKFWEKTGGFLKQLAIFLIIVTIWAFILLSYLK